MRMTARDFGFALGRLNARLDARADRPMSPLGFAAVFAALLAILLLWGFVAEPLLTRNTAPPCQPGQHIEAR
jgi:hypothetical protein